MTKAGRACRLPARRTGLCAMHEEGRTPQRTRYPRTAAQLRYDQRRRASVEDQVIPLYELGVPLNEIAALTGRTRSTVNWHLWKFRKRGRVGWRCRPIEIDDEAGSEIASLWRKGHTGGEIGRRFGWTELRTRSVIVRLRARGFNLPGRQELKAELTALIEAQRLEQRMGARALRDPRHWTAASIDRPLTADGFTILDTLGAEDENFAEMAA
jgi:hypothetical protein